MTTSYGDLDNAFAREDQRLTLISAEHDKGSTRCARPAR
jgi:hypothetical protein